jgi:hypothetical protein
MSGSNNGSLTTADTGSGANKRSLANTLPHRSYFALSPDGQLVADWTVPAEGKEAVVYLSRSDGSSRQEVMRDVSLISFAPSGRQLVVGWASETSPCPGVCLVDLDGTSLTTLTTHTGYGTISPDGTRLTWAAAGETSKTSAYEQIFVAKTDGTAPKQLTSFTSKTTPPGVYGQPQFGPGGQIAFWGEPLATNELWKINADGTGLAKVPIGGGNVWFSWTPKGQLSVTKGGSTCGMYTVNPNGTEYTRVPLNEASICHKPPSEGGGWPIGVYRQPSTQVDYTDYLAGQFEPVLRFDTSEQWRPLNVESFFGEDQHLICEGESCDEAPISSAADLNNHTGEGAYIDIAGHYTLGGGEGSYHSPYEVCTATGLRDCDTGARSAIYWRSGGTHGGYPFIDYWFFYRANYFYEEAGFHEGDWEGVTIAPSLTQGTFDYAGFSQHGTFYSYLRDVLRCEDAPATSTPASGTCGTEAGRSGFRVDTFPANGSHANYTTPCSEDILMESCRQNAEEEIFPGVTEHRPERGYDGAVRWGRAFNEPANAWSSLLKMPTTGGGFWSDWPGRWGRYGPGEGPESPALQGVSFTCASLDNDEEKCDEGPKNLLRCSAKHWRCLARPYGGLVRVLDRPGHHGSRLQSPGAATGRPDGSGRCRP